MNSATDISYEGLKRIKMMQCLTLQTNLSIYPIHAMRKDRDNEPRPSHHNEPEHPGGDHDHNKERERLKDDRRNWVEHHPKSPPPKKIK